MRYLQITINHKIFTKIKQVSGLNSLIPVGINSLLYISFCGTSNSYKDLWYIYVTLCL